MSAENQISKESMTLSLFAEGPHIVVRSHERDIVGQGPTVVEALVRWAESFSDQIEAGNLPKLPPAHPRSVRTIETAAGEVRIEECEI